MGILAAEMEGALGGTRDILVALSHSQQLMSGDRHSCEVLLASLPKHYPRFVHFGVAGLDGDVVCRSLQFEGHVNGIAPQYHDRIFRVFERLHGEEAYAGTGIGLAIARKAAERIGGRVGVESVLGEGSKFWVELHTA